MSETLKQFMAAMHYAEWNRQSVIVVGSVFRPEEVSVIVKELESYFEKL